MPLPLIAWAIGAMIAGAAAGKGAEKYGDNKIEKAKALIADAERYVNDKHIEFKRRRRQYLERMRSYVEMIRRAVRAPSGAVRSMPSELPEALKQVWADMLTKLRSLSPTAADRAGMPPTQRQEILRSLQGVSAYARFNHRDWGHFAGIAAGAVLAYDGVAKAVNGAKAYERAEAASTEMRLAADQQVASLMRAHDDLAMRWDSIVVPLMGNADSDESMAAVLLEMASDVAAELARLLQEFGDE